jgi:cytochrome P450
VLDDEKAQMIPDSVIMAEASNVIVAGTAATVMTLTYLTYGVLKHEPIKQKLIAEVNTLPKDPCWDDLEGLTYLHNVMQEA